MATATWHVAGRNVSVSGCTAQESWSSSNLGVAPPDSSGLRSRAICGQWPHSTESGACLRRRQLLLLNGSGRHLSLMSAANALDVKEGVDTVALSTDPGVSELTLPLQSAQTARPLGDAVRADFDILQQEVNGKPLVYLDSAATSQKPRQVLEAMQQYNTGYNANVHRGIHTLSARATEEFEKARAKVASFVNAASSRELVWTRNASEAINLVASTWGEVNISAGDEIVLTVAEHHSNLVPWQLLAQRRGAALKFAGLGPDGGVAVEELLSLIGPRTKLVAFPHVSNTLGSELPVKEVVEKAHKVGAVVLLDACQSVPHLTVDVQALGVDFLVASGHKMCGPTGIGFLYGRYELLQQMPPWMGGGEMISEVYLDRSTYAEPPSRFEAGTPAIAEAIGLGAAVDYLQSIGGMDKVHAYEMELGTYMYEELKKVPRVQIYGPPPGPSGSRAAALCSFNVEGVHPTDLATFLDQQHGIAVRSGHHCTQPLHRLLGINASARASCHFYNTPSEIDSFVDGLKDTIDFFTSFDAAEG